jgi:hypothetical protein
MRPETAAYGVNREPDVKIALDIAGDWGGSG